MSNEPQQQGTHFYVLTRQKPVNGGVAMATWYGAITPNPGSTRLDIYQWLLADTDQKSPHMAGANTVHFSLEPNQL